SLLYVSMYYSFVAYNALHSFPTRRSSDLVQVLFHHRGARQVRLNTATKKARQAAALALVQQDEHSHQNCGDDQYDLQSQNHELATLRVEDRKSTRLNSSHVSISYAVFCLKNNKLIR